MYFLAIGVPPADFWITSGKTNGVDNMQTSFNAVFGQGMRIIVGSIVAFLVSQLVDVYIFHKIKKITGDKKIWLRATGLHAGISTDRQLYCFIYCLRWCVPLAMILAIGMMNYTYKFTMAIILTPVIVLVEKRIEKYVGHDVARKMKRAAMGEEDDGFVNIPAAG